MVPQFFAFLVDPADSHHFARRTGLSYSLYSLKADIAAALKKAQDQYNAEVK